MALGLSAAGTVAYWTGFRPRSQVFGAFPFRGPTAEKLVALSFDDGPNEPYTSRLLDTLDDRGVKATFFQVGRCAQRFPSTTRRIVQTGHVLGNHSYSHSFRRYLSQPRQQREISRSQDVLHSITGVTPALYRPPWLCHWPWVLRSVQDHQLQVVSGTFAHPLGSVPTARETDDFRRRPDHPAGHDLDLPRRPRSPRRSARPERGRDRPADRPAQRSGIRLHDRRPAARGARLRDVRAEWSAAPDGADPVGHVDQPGSRYRPVDVETARRPPLVR